MNRSQIYSESTGAFLVQNNHCFTCSNNRVTVEVASVVLQLQGFGDIAKERKTILQVICQLLRVRWESVAEIMTVDDGKSHFCATCFKVMTSIILLREKMLQIETEIRNELKKIEESVVMTWTENGHTLEEVGARPEINEDVRTTFQRQVMEEICNKKLLHLKVAEFHQTSNSDSVDLKLSMVQLNLEKNVFEIGAKSRKHEFMNMTPNNADTEVDIDKVKVILDSDDPEENWTLSYSSVSVRDTNPKFRIRAVPADTSTTSSNIAERECDEFTLMTVPPVICDSESELCPVKKSKWSDIATTFSTDQAQHLVEHPRFISSLSKLTQTKRESLVSPGTTATSPILKSKSPKTSPKRKRGKRTTAVSTHKAKRRKNTKSTPKRKNSPIISNLMEIEFDAAEDDADDDLIFGDEMTSEEDNSETNSSDSDDSGSTDEDETFNESDIEKEGKTEKANEEMSDPIGTTSCSRQLFKPKFSRTAKPNQEQASIKLKQAETTFIAKDKSTWTTKEPKDSQRIRDYEVLHEKGGLIGPAQNTKLTPAEIFKLMFPPSIVEKIVKYTNKHAEHVESKKKVPRNASAWYPVTVDEMYAYIGMLLLLGVEKKRHVSFREFWTSDEKYSMPAIVATMSRQRFAKIQTHLRFDDAQARKSGPITESENDANSKRFYISELLDSFVEVMQSHLNPYDTLILDEMLVKFRGHSKFRVYMKSKPGKYGMKFWALCDVETGYILKISLYHGKVGDTVAKELGKTVVLDLVKKYFNSGRAVTIDNFFTSKALGEELMKHKMSMLGTLNRNRMDVIPEFNDPKGRDVESSIFAFQGDFTMVSYIQRKNRAAILLSTQHHSPEICPGTKNKPRMILDYNATKGGVDTADQMIANCSCQRSTRRWPVKVFYALLDIAAFNAYAVNQHHVSLDKEKVFMDRRFFLRNVSENLMKPFIAKRVETLSNRHTGIQTPLYKALVRMGYEKQIKKPENDLIPPGIFRCSKCLLLEALAQCNQTGAKCQICKDASLRSTEQKKAVNRCFVCGKRICESHSAIKHWCMIDGVECHKS